MNEIIITIDGPAGSGKTSLSKLISEKYNLLHIRGGTYFRSLTYGIIKNNINPNDKNLVIKYAKIMNLKISSNNNYKIFLDNFNITNKIHNNDINNIITLISNYNEIRMLRKKWILSIKDNKNIIADGRTLGNEIFPNATLKFHLTANVNIRAKRKHKMLDNLDLQTTINLINKRDTCDKNSIHKKMEVQNDTICIDSSNLSINETLILFSKYIDKVHPL